MAQVRCSNCGKRNPSELEICQFCQAPLKPARGSPPPFKDADAIEPASETPDWLRELDPADSEARKTDQPAGEETQPAGEQESPEAVGFPEGESLPVFDTSDAIAKEESAASGPSSEEPALPGTPQAEADKGEEPLAAAQVQEESGPLAGLTGLLSADQGLPRLPGQATRPLHLRITANQRLHADLLHTLVEMEGQPRPLPKPPGLASRRAQTWAIALVLILSVLWPLLRQGSLAGLENSYSEEAAELNRLVSQLPAEAKILVAFDYEPAFAAELEAAATPVLDHLMSQGAYLTFISTNPLGPVLADRLVQGPLADHEYTRGDQYINLGFVPGGAAGILSLVEAPKQTLPYTIEGVPAWGTDQAPALPPLEGIQSLEDFSLVLVVVDDPDLARTWIEQVSPRQSAANPIALGMVTSAQVEALLQPYYQSVPRQVSGFASGLRGGAAYTLMTGRETTIQGYWNAFGIGLFVVALILVVGAVLHASTLPGQAEHTQEGEGRS